MHLENRILVTGGAGFLGSHLCERLLAEGANVICVDNFFTGTRSNIEHLLEHQRFELIRHDVTFPLYRRGRRDLQPGLPGLADPLPARSGADDQDQRARRDQHAGPRQARAARRSSRPRPRRSTATRSVHPQTEDYWGNVNPIGPRSCYDEGKRCAETLFFDYHRQHKLRDQGRAHLQHLRPAHAPERRPRGVELHRPGAARPRHHGLRRRRADALVLLRRRPDRRPHAADGRPATASPARSTSAIPTSSPSCSWPTR